MALTGLRAWSRSPPGCVRETERVREVVIFTAWRLQLYGYAAAVIYVCFLVSCYRAGTWIVDRNGVPIYTDFACAWIAAVQALHGHAASLSDPASFIAAQAAFVGPRDDFYPNWPYPPIFLLIMAPFAALQYVPAFLTWDVLTLAGCLAVAYAITRRAAAAALVLAWPFTAWNFLAAQNGFLTASLLGAGLLLLERQPILAGVFIGFLTYKPQFGILFPVALAAARQWRAMASTAVTAALVAGVSIAAFGVDAWTAFPRELLAQNDLNLLGDSDSNWGYLQTVYGLVRFLHGGAWLASSVQAATTFACALAVWLVWRSEVRFSLKAAVLSAAALLATPYAFAYDMAALVVPAAFLAKDQLGHGLLKGEQALGGSLFGGALALLLVLRDTPDSLTFGSTPAGILVALALLGMILRRALRGCEQPMISPRRSGLVSSPLS